VAVSDFYTVKSGSVAVATVSVLPVLSLVSPATKRSWITGVRVEIGVTGALAGNSILFQLARPSATNTGTTTATPTAHDFYSIAALSTGYTAYSTAPTLGVVLAEWTLPQTTGSMWEEFPPTGEEWGVPAIATGAANSGVHLFVTASVATSTPVFADIIFSE
jgi:hypothetical protein